MGPIRVECAIILVGRLRLRRTRTIQEVGEDVSDDLGARAFVVVVVGGSNLLIRSFLSRSFLGRLVLVLDDDLRLRRLLLRDQLRPLELQIDAHGAGDFANSPMNEAVMDPTH